MDWKKKTLLIYTIGGLICGVFAGLITINNAVSRKKELDLSLKDGARLGMAAMEVVRKTVIK